MGLLSILEKGIRAMIDEATTPESFKIGESFEYYVREFLFDNDYYDLVEKSHSYNQNSQDFVEATLKPDFKFRDRKTKKEFYVEAKFRTGLNNGKITWCNARQLERYNSYNNELPMFLILGFGNDPERPEFLSLIPISEAKYTGLFPSYAEKFEVTVDKTISSKTLWGKLS